MTMATKLTAIAVLFYFSSISTIAVVARKPQVLRLPLTHRDSPSSPFYDPNITEIERVERDIARSMLRYAYLNDITPSSSSTHDTIIRADLKSGPGTYYVKLGIGTPPFPVLLFVDTASDLTWTQCLPCEECYDQQSPIFDPTKSQTYTNISCHSDLCTDLPYYDCILEQELCHYDYIYQDGSNTGGNLGKEAISLNTMSDEGYVLSEIAFGCGHKNRLASAGEIAGILGLGHHNKVSLISQAVSYSYIEPRFSYCLMEESEKTSMSHLVLGAFFGTDYTPLEITEGRYRVVLEDITVGKTRLNLPPGTFNRSSESGGGGVLLDSATTLSFLAEKGYNIFVEELEKQLNLEVDGPRIGALTRCYSGTMENRLALYKGVTFHFAGGLNLLMEQKNLFLDIGGWQFCLTVLPAGLGRSSVLGNFAQQSTAVAFDLKEHKVAFTKTHFCHNF